MYLEKERKEKEKKYVLTMAIYSCECNGACKPPGPKMYTLDRLWSKKFVYLARLADNL